MKIAERARGCALSWDKTDSRQLGTGPEVPARQPLAEQGLDQLPRISRLAVNVLRATVTRIGVFVGP